MSTPLLSESVSLGHHRPRIVLYTHDTFGLGHVRRCLNIIRKLAKEVPDAAILLVTGCPAMHFFSQLPPNVDVVKIPTMVKTGASGSLPPHLPLGISEMTLLRSRIILETVTAFQPDLFLADNFPLGAQGELLPVLQALKNRHTPAVLGLRDILDGGDVVRAEWARQGVYDALDRYYDKILIYGMQNVFDAVQEYAIPERTAKKVHFCGYLTTDEPLAECPVKLREKIGAKGPLLLATGGGGGDAFPLLENLIDAAAHLPDSLMLIFTGPMMGASDRKALESRINGNSNIRIDDFVSDLRPYMLAADLVVSMCGYNIAAEIVYNRARALVVPRTWRFGEHKKRKETREEKEQILRAQLMAKSGLVYLVEQEGLTPETLAGAINEALAQRLPLPDVATIQMDGLHHAAQHLLDLVR